MDNLHTRLDRSIGYIVDIIFTFIIIKIIFIYCIFIFLCTVFIIIGDKWLTIPWKFSNSKYYKRYIKSTLYSVILLLKSQSRTDNKIHLFFSIDLIIRHSQRLHFVSRNTMRPVPHLPLVERVPKIFQLFGLFHGGHIVDVFTLWK